MDVIVHQHEFCVKVENTSMDDRSEMRRWCKDNVGEGVKHWGYNYSIHNAYFYFAKETDATLFKLTWL